MVGGVGYAERLEWPWRTHSCEICSPAKSLISSGLMERPVVGKRLKSSHLSKKCTKGMLQCDLGPFAAFDDQQNCLGVVDATPAKHRSGFALGQNDLGEPDHPKGSLFHRVWKCSRSQYLSKTVGPVALVLSK